MKNLFVYLLVFELMLIPLGQSVQFSFAADDDDDEENECPQGQAYDTSLNRCVLTSSTVDNKTEAMNCEGLEGDEFKDCFNNNVNDELADAESKGDIKKASEPEKKYGVPAVVTIGAAVILWKKKDVLKQCGQTSMWLMLGGGLSSLLGEFMAQKSYQKKVKGLAEKYKKRMEEKPLDDQEVVAAIDINQRLAFEFQIEQETARKKAHEARKKAYNLAFGLYTASALASIYDGITGSWKSCDSGSASLSSGNSTSIRKYAKLKNSLILNKDLFGDYYFMDEITKDEYSEMITRKVHNFFLPSAKAAGEMEVIEIIGKRWSPGQSACSKKLDPGGAVGLGQLGTIAGFSDCLTNFSASPEQTIIKGAGESGTDSTIDQAIKSPAVRAAIAAILAGYSKKVAKDAGKLAKESEGRIALLKDLMASFEANGGAGFQYCTEEERSSRRKPACYCYLKDGQQDASKIKDPTCASIFAKAASLAATQYGAILGDSEQGLKGCFTKSKKFDENCKCRAVKSKSGSDDCLRISGKLKMGSLGSIHGLKDMMKDTVGFTQGNISTGELDSAKTDNLALRMNKAKNKILKNPKYRKPMLRLNKLEKKLRNQLSTRTKRGLSSGAISNPFGGGLNAALGGVSAKDALKNLKKEVKDHKANFKSGNSLAGKGKKRGSNGYNFNDSASGSGGINIDDIDSVMKKEYSFNDISENPNNNIFKIITNRYQRSGLRRLFDDKGISQADEANGSEISGK